MSKLLALIEEYKSENTKLGLGIDETLLEAVTRGLGPSIYNADACKVSSSDETELATVKNNYLIKKLGLSDTPELMTAIQEVMETLGSSNRKKYRALVYSMLCAKFNKQDIYDL